MSLPEPLDRRCGAAGRGGAARGRCTKEDAHLLTATGALPAQRILGVETSGCPHTAIREDVSINLAAIAQMRARFPRLDGILIESGRDNLAATVSPELADLR